MSSKTADTYQDEWVRRWEVGDTSFHQPSYDPFFDEYEERMFDGRTKRVFAPLCGKSLDLIWMYQRTHTVVGVEIAEQPVRELFVENKILFNVTEIDKVGKLYKSLDGRLQIYVADLFDLTPDLCGQFDIIWDSKSLVAINREDQAKYVDLLLSLMKKDGSYYLWTLEYKHPTFPGPPHSFPDQMTRDLYGSACNIELIEEKDKTNKKVMTEDDLAKLNADIRGLMTSSSLTFRWYCMKFK